MEFVVCFALGCVLGLGLGFVMGILFGRKTEKKTEAAEVKPDLQAQRIQEQWERMMTYTGRNHEQ